MPALPPPRHLGRYRIALVCLGNICRSPMAETVLRARVRATGLDDVVEVVSSGTGDWHVGQPMDERAAAVLREHGYDGSAHRAQQIRASWLADHDLVLAMDAQNLRDLRALGRAEPERVRLFGDFDPTAPGAEVPDPYYGDRDGFPVVLGMVERTADALVEQLRSVV